MTDREAIAIVAQLIAVGFWIYALLERFQQIP